MRNPGMFSMYTDNIFLFTSYSIYIVLDTQSDRYVMLEYISSMLTPTRPVFLMHFCETNYYLQGYYSNAEVILE